MLGGSKRTDLLDGLQTPHGQDESRMPEWDGRAQGVAERSAKLRAFFARHFAASGCARDPRIEQAFTAVPREPFAGPAPRTGLSLPVVGPLRLSIDCLCAHGGLTGHPQVGVPGALVDGLLWACRLWAHVGRMWRLWRWLMRWRWCDFTRPGFSKAARRNRTSESCEP